MEPGILDTLVKLAALGTSGVSIFAIFWIGWLILNIPKDASPERHKTLRMFMVITVIIALISGATGFANAKFNADEIGTLTEEKKDLQSDFDAYKTKASADFEAYKEEVAAKLSDYKQKETETKSAAEALGEVLKSKEAHNLQNPSSEIETHINLLKAFLTKMKIDTGG